MPTQSSHLENQRVTMLAAVFMLTISVLPNIDPLQGVIGAKETGDSDG